MFNVQIDENVVKELCVEEIQKKVKEYDAELAFWDTKELKNVYVCRGIQFRISFSLTHASQNSKWVKMVFPSKTSTSIFS